VEGARNGLAPLGLAASHGSALNRRLTHPFHLLDG
jgi:hypothetical protein